MHRNYMSNAIVSIHLSVECPKCGKSNTQVPGLLGKLSAIDCLHFMNGNDTIIQPHIFTCEFCQKEITVTNISNSINQPLPF